MLPFCPFFWDFRESFFKSLQKSFPNYYLKSNTLLIATINTNYNLLIIKYLIIAYQKIRHGNTMLLLPAANIYVMFIKHLRYLHAT